MTLTGRAAVAVAVALPLTLVLPTWAWASWLLLVFALIIVDVVIAPRTTLVDMMREPLGPITLGEATETRLTCTAQPTRRRLRVQVLDVWQPSAGGTYAPQPMTLRAGESRDVVTALTPTRRGDITGGTVTVRSRGPLGLACRQRTRSVPGVLRVLPPFHSRTQLPGLLRSMQLIDGHAVARQRGQGTEFDSLREYTPGDDVRSIDWRATARHRTTVVKLWRPERDRHVMILLDTSRTSAARIGDLPRIEHAMEAVQLLAALAHQSGDRVTVLTGRPDGVAQVTARSRDDITQPLAHHLALVNTGLHEAPWDVWSTEILTRVPHRALVVLLTDADPVVAREHLAPLLPRLTRRYHVVVGSLTDPALHEHALLPAEPPEAPEQDGELTPHDVYAAAAAERALVQRELTCEALGRMGVTTLTEEPADLPRRVCEHYLALKKRGEL